MKLPASRAVLGTLVHFIALALLPSIVQAQQSGTLEPCPATPSISKPGSQALGASRSVEPRVSQTLVDSSIPDEPDVLRILGPYRAKVHELNVVIGRLEGDLRKGGVGAGSLGNFVTDGLRVEASRKLGKPVVLTVSNSGGLRKNSIAQGGLRVQDIFELLPFENALIQIELTGEQLLKLLKGAVAAGDPQSGARISYRLNADKKPEMVSARLIDTRGRESAINPKTTYPIVTTDYLYGLSSGTYAILREGKNMKPLGITMRDALLRYVRTETARGRPVRAKLDGRFNQIGSTSEAGPE